ncbi:hypothetical protein ACTMS0_22130 [Micromonospora sp. H33]|uniref:hypothetical protein n=1 Tax=Micromonospora sp. H33 TaxID=3452215 RepID=UPI003F8CD647
MATAEIILDSQDPALAVVDFAGTVTIDRSNDERSRVFTGSIIDVTPIGAEIHILCKTGAEFIDRPIGGLAAVEATALDLIYGLVRSAGLPDERISIEGLERLPTEVFEVAFPIVGLTVDDVTRVGSTSFIPANSGLATIAAFNDDSELLREFVDAEAVAVCYVTARTMFEAEYRALSIVDGAIAWLLVRSRYSGAQLTSGSNQEWHRASLSMLPQRLEVAAVRGLSTARSWIRRLEDPVARKNMTAKDIKAMMPPMADRISETDRQALLACARAINSHDPVIQVTALWEAIEYYVGDTVAPAMFTRAELRAIRRSLPPDIKDEKRRRVEDMIGLLNTPPLIARLRYRLASDGVPISESEVLLLKRLRGVRNNVAHGKVTERVEESDITYGTAIVVRMLVAAMERRLSGDAIW